MTFVKGKSANPGGRRAEKPFFEAIKMELSAAGGNHKALREVARKLIEQAMLGEPWAIQMIADRLDGKPAQESTVTIEKRDASDWSMAELDAILDGARASRMGKEASTSGSSELN